MPRSLEFQACHDVNDSPTKQPRTHEFNLEATKLPHCFGQSSNQLKLPTLVWAEWHSLWRFQLCWGLSEESGRGCSFGAWQEFVFSFCSCTWAASLTLGLFTGETHLNFLALLRKYCHLCQSICGANASTNTLYNIWWKYNYTCNAFTCSKMGIPLYSQIPKYLTWK